MTGIAWRMLAHKPIRLLVTWCGLGVLFFLAAVQMGLLVGWCNTVSALVRHTDADVWVMAEQTPAFDYGTAIPRQRVYQARSIEGVAWAEALFMAWNVWQRPDGRRVNIELVGLDNGCVGGPWAMKEGTADRVLLPDGVIVDDLLFLDQLGVRQVGDEVEMLGRRAVVRGISTEVRTFTASPFIFTSLAAARKYDKRYGPDDITYVLVRCSPGHSPESVRDRLRAELPHVEVLTCWEFAIRTMRYWMLETGAGLTVILAASLGLTVSVVVTSQTLYAVTQEYLANYATLVAVGFGRWQMLACVLIQGMILAAGEILLGSAGFVVAARFSASTNLPLETTPEVYAGLVAFSMGSCLLGGSCRYERSCVLTRPPSSGGDMGTVLQCDEVHHTYGQGTVAESVLLGVSASFAAGEVCVLMGPSGSGKTTLLSILGCMLKPTTGELKVCGERVDWRSPKRLTQYRRVHLGFVFQHAQLLPFLTVGENLEVVGRNAGLSASKLGKRIEELLVRLGITAMRHKKPDHLSGGQRQRVAIARAVLHRPAILLADEPTAALDWQHGQEAVRLLVEQAQTEGAMLLTVTHDSRLLPMFGRVLRIEGGRLAEESRS